MKSVLVSKQKEWEVREARAMARQAKVDQEDDEDIDDIDGLKQNLEGTNRADPNTKEGHLSVPQSLMKTNILGKVY